MRLNKAELFFIAMLVFLSGVGGALLWMYYGLLRLSGGATETGGLPLVQFNQLIIAAALFLTLAIASALMMLLPHIRLQVKKDGYLKIITWTIARRSQDLQRETFTDPVSGLQNRRYFDEALREYLLQFGKISKSVSVILIVVDDFSKLSDARGRTASDVILAQVGQLMRNCTRYHDVLARLEGDEFALIAPNITAVDASRMAMRIAQAIRQLEIDGTTRLSASAGIAVWDGAENAVALYARATEQLMQASLQGTERICI